MNNKNLYPVTTISNRFKIRLKKPKSTLKIDKDYNSISNQNNNDFLKSLSFSKSQKFKTPIKENEKSNNYQSGFKPNACIMGNKCPYYKKYHTLKNEVKLIITSNNQINYFNESLYNSLLQKTNLYQLLMDENEQLKRSFFELTSKRYFNMSSEKNKNLIQSPIREKKHKQLLSFNKNKPKHINMSSNDFQSIINSPNKNNFDTTDIDNLLKKIQSGKKNQIITHHSQKNISQIRNSSMINNCDPKIHYELINDYTNQQNRKNVYDKNKYSFLSPEIDFDAIIKINYSLNILNDLTKNDQEFLSIISTSSNEQLLKYNDHIIILMNDYQEMIKLGMRLKNFIKGSMFFEESLIEGNCIKVLMDTACNILDCDRVSLFVLDKISDKLVVYSGEGLKKAQIKVPKDKGIVGSCFMKSTVIRIDDVYLDDRFNPEVDKKTNYRTKSILCHPLIDKNDECFGVFEAINKNNPPFNEDDEEFLKYFSHQASIIFKSMNSIDDNKYLAWNLMNIVDYNLSLDNIKNKVEFTEKTEELLLDVFCCINAKFYFVENNQIVHYNGKNVTYFDTNIGIIGKVIKIKDVLGYQKISDSVEYNSFIDLDSNSGLLTFPILRKKTKDIAGVVQVPYIGKISKHGKPKDSEMKLIKKLTKCMKNWIERNCEKKN